MIIYRPQRGTLEEAMKEAKEFETEDEMKDHIVKVWDGLVKKEDIVITRIPFEDVRIGWKDCRFVCINKLGDEDYIKEYGCPQCIGYCATDYEQGGK